MDVCSEESTFTYDSRKTLPKEYCSFHLPIHSPTSYEHRGTSLVVQWLRIHLPMQGTHGSPHVERFHMPPGNSARVPQILGTRVATTGACTSWGLSSATREAPAMRSPCAVTREQPLPTATRERSA